MVVVYHSDYLKHIQHFGHPECPERVESIVNRLKKDNICEIIKPTKVGIDTLTKIHKPDYVNLIKNFGEGYYDMDTYVRNDTFEIASLAVGGALLATKYAYENYRQSFAVVRPPGHHAGVGYAGGFCYFNNVAISAQTIAETNRKVAIIDLDLHHGNGTADIFYRRCDVLYISTHLWGIYPGTGAMDEVGESDGEGFTVNIPFGGLCGDESFKYAFDKIIEPIVTDFKPAMILVSLGGDAHYRDPLGNLTLSSNGYIYLTKKIITLNSRCTFILEGGYDIPALTEIVVGMVGDFYNKKIDLKFTKILDTNCKGRSTVDDVVKIQRKYWKLS